MNQIPGYTNPTSPNALIDLEARLGARIYAVGGVWFTDGDPTAVQNYLNSYVGGPDELAYYRSAQQALLDAEFDQHFDLAKFIRGGTVTTVTATNVGNFLAQITNNYRSLRAQIAAAATVAAVQAINIASGWPSNP